MARETLPSTIEDRQAQLLADYVEGDLLKIFVYEQSIVKNKFITMVARGVTYVTINQATAIPQRIESGQYAGEHYFEALAEVTDTGTLQALDKTNLTGTKFVNISSIQLVTNGFKKLLNDTPKLYTIGKPFDYEEYRKGNQGVYTATIEPVGYFSKTDLIQDKIIDEGSLLEDIELTEMSLNNLNSVEKQLDNSRLIILPYALNLEDPRVDVKKGKYLKFTFDDLVQINGWKNSTVTWTPDRNDDGSMATTNVASFQTLANGLNIMFRDIDGHGDRSLTFIAIDILIPTEPARVENLVNISLYQLEKMFNKNIGTLTHQILQYFTKSELETLFLKYVIGRSRTNTDPTTDPFLSVTPFFNSAFYDNAMGSVSPNIPLFLPENNKYKAPVKPLELGGAYTILNPAPQGKVFPHQIDDVILELKFNLNFNSHYVMLEHLDDANIGQFSSQVTVYWQPNKYEVHHPLGATNEVRILNVEEDSQVFVGSAGKQYVQAHEFQYELKNQPGFKVELSAQALVSSLNSTAMVNNVRQDLAFNTTTDMIPLLIKILDDRDRVEIAIPWFNPELTPPLYWLKAFMGENGGTLDTLITNETDLEVLHDMLLLTKLVKDKFRSVPLDDKNEIPFNSKFGIYLSGATTAALKGGTGLALNDALFSAWMDSEVLQMSDERVLRMRSAITLLSDYIASSYAIGSGTNKFNRVHQPYYLRHITPLLVHGLVIADKSSRWVINSLSEDKTSHDKPAEILANFKKVAFKLESEYFGIGADAIVTLDMENLSDILVKKAEGNVAIPKLPQVVSRQKQLSYGADVDTKSDEAMSYLVFLAVNDPFAANFLMLFDEKSQMGDPKVPVNKTFDLEGLYIDELSTEEIKTKIDEHVFRLYGVKAADYEVVAMPTREIDAPVRQFLNSGDERQRQWPTWIQAGIPYASSGKFDSSRYDYDPIERYILNRAHAFSPLSTHSTDVDEIYLKYMVRNIDGEYKNVPLDKIAITNYTAAKAAGDTKIWYNEELTQQDYRWWRFNFEYTVQKYKYTNVKIRFKTSYQDYGLNTRPQSFNKEEFYAWLKAINNSKSLLYEGSTHEYTLWTDSKIDYIESIDLSALWVDEFNIIINGFRIPVPALNRETPTLTWQKTILP